MIKKKKEKTPKRSIAGLSGKTAILERGKKSFIIPEREKRNLERLGKIEPQQIAREKRQQEERIKAGLPTFQEKFGTQQPQESQIRVKSSKGLHSPEFEQERAFKMQQVEEKGVKAFDEIDYSLAQYVKDKIETISPNELISGKLAAKGKLITGTVPLAIGGGTILASGSFMKIQQAAAGKLPYFAAGASRAGSRIAVNSVNAGKTSSWLAGLAATAKSPQAVSGMLMGAVGSYPFAGFINEEAIQTIGFDVKSALDSGDYEAATEALALERELLNPDFSNKVLAAIPYANVMKKLDNFFKAAREKYNHDVKRVEQMKNKVNKEEDLISKEYWAQQHKQKLGIK